METFRILLVEDKPEVMLTLKRALGAVPDQIIDLARDTQEAIIYLEGLFAFAEPLPAVVVLDASSPNADALELLKWIQERSEFRATPVLVLGDSTNAQFVNKAYHMGASSFAARNSGGHAIVNEVQRLCADGIQRLRTLPPNGIEFGSLPDHVPFINKVLIPHPPSVPPSARL